MSTLLQQVFLQHGQSPWLDNLQRSFLTDGTLKQLVDSGVRGLTSNPTIFQKAIQGSSDYDEQFEREIKKGLSPIDAYWEMVLADINGALDVFEHLYRQSEGDDGFVSVEVNPSLATHGEETLNAARSLHDRIDRPNVMIKIPATQEGLPAIQAMISEGRSVNVTLIFSLQRYSDVIDAYIMGLEERLSAGLDISRVRSVASFFISRVDNVIDAQLDSLGTEESARLKGTAAISQAKMAYALFQEKFSGDRWKKLENAGAHVQRPLWASTSTKNPSYPDTLYVDSLIGSNTVNTLPDATLKAFADHGVIARTIDADIEQARVNWASLQALGIDVDEVARTLEHEGVASFMKSFDELLDALRDKASSIS
jgi:transaldolase